MSNEFRNFSEAARLYAKYSLVVDEMYELFKADVSAFFDALRDRVKSQVRTGVLGTEEGGAGRSWYIADADMDEDEDVPYIWFRPQQAQIVTPGVLALAVYADGDLQPYRQQLAAMLSETQFPPTCKRLGGSGVQSFALTITYGEDSDPVGVAAEPVLTLLTAVYNSWKKLPTTDSKPNPGR